jgi:hypothetical protein
VSNTRLGLRRSHNDNLNTLLKAVFQNSKSRSIDTIIICQHVFQKNLTKLYLARQWRQRSPDKEEALLGHSCVEGFVFSSFRHDNPGPIRRNDWTVKPKSSAT